MRSRLAVLGVAALLLGTVAIPGPATAAGPAAVAPPTPRIVATFPTGYDWGSFAESLAIDQAGNMFVTVTIWIGGDEVTWNRGQIWKISPSGRMRQVGPDLDVGILSGLAFDAHGNLYAGLITFDIADVPSGVLRIDPDGHATRVVTLLPGTFPNGLAFHDGDLYISDSYNGAVWRAHPRGYRNEVLAEPWLQHKTLAIAEGSEGWEGVNGIAFRGDTLYAVNADTGSVVRIPMRWNGSAGRPAVVVTDPALVGSDGIAFDEDGGLWIAVNHGDLDAGGALVRMSRTGHLRVIANDPGWLDYPSQPAFGTRRGDRTTLYVVNGSLNTGNCNLIALKAGVEGQRLP